MGASALSVTSAPSSVSTASMASVTSLADPEDSGGSARITRSINSFYTTWRERTSERDVSVGQEMAVS